MRLDVLNKFEPGGSPRSGFGDKLLLRGVLPFLLQALYEGAFLSRGGRTPAKRMLGLKVMKLDGSELTARSAWARAGVRFLLAIIPMMSVFDNLLIFSEDRRTLHDRAAGTVVVKT